MDNNLYRFWSLDEFVSWSESLGNTASKPAWADSWFVFADCLCESHLLAVRLSLNPDDGGPVAIPNGAKLIAVAPTFGAFLDLYLTKEEGHLFECGMEEIEG